MAVRLDGVDGVVLCDLCACVVRFLMFLISSRTELRTSNGRAGVGSVILTISISSSICCGFRNIRYECPCNSTFQMQVSTFTAIRSDNSSAFGKSGRPRMLGFVSYKHEEGYLHGSFFSVGSTILTSIGCCLGKMGDEGRRKRLPLEDPSPIMHHPL